MRDFKTAAIAGAMSGMGVMTRDAGGSAKDEYEKLAGQLKTRLTTLDKLIEDKQKLLAENKDDTETRDAIEKLQASVKDVSELSARFEELEQKMVRGVQDGELDPNSIGGLLSRNEGISQEIKAIKHSRGKVQIDGVSARNTVMLGTINTAGNINDAQMINPASNPLTLVNMINWIPTSVPLIPYVRESAVTFMADIVAEGELKPESSLE